MNDTPSVAYHQLARPNGRGRAFGESLLVAVYWIVATVVSTIVVLQVSGADKLQELDAATGMLLGLGIIALQGPAAWLAAKSVGRDPRQLFGVSGRLRWRLFGKLAGIALLLKVAQFGIDAVVVAIADPGALTTDFAWPGFEAFIPAAAVLIVLVPLQIAGEELVYRGTLMQTVGAWARSPWWAIVISTVAFTLNHRGSDAAMVSIAVYGLTMGWLTIRTGGLEASLALHWANNTLGLLLVAAAGGLSLDKLNADVSWLSAGLDVAMQLVFLVIAVRITSAKGALAATDQIEQHAPERRLGVEHADHRSSPEPLAP
jgi:membrane protease YdiL (CAAX protease family)